MLAIIPGRYMFRIAFSTFLLFLYTLLTPQHGSTPSESANSMALRTIVLSACAITPGSPNCRRMNGKNSRIAPRWRSPCLPNMPRSPEPPSIPAAAAISSLLTELTDKSVVAVDALSSSGAWAAAYGYNTSRTDETNTYLSLSLSTTITIRVVFDVLTNQVKSKKPASTSICERIIWWTRGWK